ncbi:MAG: class I mannose-6-phosphate isomerase [Anaerolineae bacterium]|nr:class I mannose-6-phosphate isomerase [Anaerolineae bacterium]
MFQLIPQYQERVWGGQRLKPATPPIGEAWLVYEGNKIANGPYAGQTLAEVAEQQGAALLGAKVVAQTGHRFPLLIKLLDAADWLSVQVHPNDAQAVALEGAGQFGKTEAWHMLQADPTAQVISGVKSGTPFADLADAIRNGTILDWVKYHKVAVGDTIFMPAGNIHALGPGLLLYEVQQTSDITYRVYDWGRPASAGRKLHIEQSVAVSDPNSTGDHRPAPILQPTDQAELVQCPYFTLDLITSQSETQQLDTAHASFHAITMIEGSAEISCADEKITLNRFNTVIVPANAGAYNLTPIQPFRALLAHVS